MHTDKEFFCRQVVLYHSAKSLEVEVLKGHAILLTQGDSLPLKLAALLDGTSLDVLFPEQGKRGQSGASAAEVKSIISTFQNESQQQAIVAYYADLYKAICSFYNKLEHAPWLCYNCYFNSAKEEFEIEAGAAFKTLYLQTFS